MTAFVSYLVTREIHEIPSSHQVFMVDGTVPGWTPGSSDHHWDHHRRGGMPIQVDEMPELSREETLLTQLGDGRPACIVTTMLDADACVASAWLQLKASDVSTVSRRRLRAIAFDCDHLGVPPNMLDLREFAADAVANMRMRGQREIEDGSTHSEQFAIATKWLIDAVKERREWPLRNNHVREFWRQVDCAVDKLCREDRVKFSDGVAIVDTRGCGITDARAVNQAVMDYPCSSNTNFSGAVVSFREPNDHASGWVYTVGSIPARFHHDFSACDVWRALTEEEATVRGIQWSKIAHIWNTAHFSKVAGFDPWGGRATVGGSGWRTPSPLTPRAVARCVTRCLNS